MTRIVRIDSRQRPATPILGVMHVARTPGLPDPSFEQVLVSPQVRGGIACAEGDAPHGLVRGVWDCRALGFSFLTRGRMPLAKRKPTRTERAVRESVAEGLQHSLFHVFGTIGGGLVRGLLGKGDYKQKMRAAEEILRDPRCFAIPWTALVGAEYAGDPVEVALEYEAALFDPLVLTEERDGTEQRHTLLVERTAAAEGPTLPALELFGHR